MRVKSNSFGGHFEVDKKRERLKNIEQMEAMEGFWNDADEASKIEKEKKVLEDVVATYDEIKVLFDDLGVLIDFSKEGDEESFKEAQEKFALFDKSYARAEQKVLLSQQTDLNNAIVTIHAGAGGTESCDWASMLQRMIARWCEHKKFKLNLLDEQSGDSAGIKSCTFTVEGAYAYGLLKSEIGVHRLVRISPFDSNARRHTSFASVFVSPEVDDDIEIEIEDKDVRIDVFRAQGAGGQSVNTTDSAVRLTHKPSGIVVACQNERSQLQNKTQAFKVLRSKLYELELEKQREKEREAEAGKKKIEWGAQIRSYVLHPYKMVKDHRTNFEMGNAEKVLDGDLSCFMDAYLRWDAGAYQESEEEKKS